MPSGSDSEKTGIELNWPTATIHPIKMASENAVYMQNHLMSSFGYDKPLSAHVFHCVMHFFILQKA